MTTKQSAANPSSTAKLPFRLHHHAYVVEDQERTRHFYEDIIGLPLRATWIESVENKDETLIFSHTFYGIADGGALAFFNFADPKINARFNVGRQPNICYHIALSVDEETQAQIRQRCQAQGVTVLDLDHGYCKSLYVTDPDGLQVEFTVDPPDVDKINAVQEGIARASLDRWQKGDTRPNNDIRPHG